MEESQAAPPQEETNAEIPKVTLYVYRGLFGSMAGMSAFITVAGALDLKAGHGDLSTVLQNAACTFFILSMLTEHRRINMLLGGIGLIFMVLHYVNR